MFVFDTTILQPLIDTWQAPPSGCAGARPARRVHFAVAARTGRRAARKAAASSCYTAIRRGSRAENRLTSFASTRCLRTTATHPPRSSETRPFASGSRKRAVQCLTFKDQGDLRARGIADRPERCRSRCSRHTGNAWLKQLTSFYLKPYPVETYANRLAALPLGLNRQLPTLEQLGFAPGNLAGTGLAYGHERRTASA